ncbi:MAG: bifunctional phosphoglucose/phosphomannose isomerase [Chloroflexi bacterium]|nr:bifunctional phosphoglucose/phosphomannose isomerase [Chloroflexota bacterium]
MAVDPHILDTVAALRTLDPAGMIDHVRAAPEQFRRAWHEAADFALPERYGAASQIVVLGMGGSAIGGDLVGGLIADSCPRPYRVVREYDLPASADDQTLVVASSYSGNTEETLTAARQSLARGAMVLGITTGGELARLLADAGAPVFRYQFVSQPRAALGYGMMPLLAFLQQLGLTRRWDADLEAGLAAMERLAAEIGVDVPLDRNPAKQLASRLHGRFAVVYGAGVLAAVARRWKGQINENAKAWAFFEALPEINHNAVVGYSFPSELADRVFVVLLAGEDPPRIRRRQEVTSDLLSRAGIPHQIISAPGAGQLPQLLTAVSFGDYVSYYLAALNGVDPTPVAAIDYLKAQLSQ